MSVIKSVSVGHGDMFYIRHNSDNFTMIDCMLPSDDDRRSKEIVDELLDQSSDKNVVRFISTHPDQDHVRGLRYLDSRMELRNFYCIKNSTTKNEPRLDFLHYCKLRDSDKAFYIHKGCSRRWMNRSDEQRGASGINILWPDTSNADFQAALEIAEGGGSPNNTSAFIRYSLNDGVTALWMGDIENGFMQKIDGEVDVPKVDILFAPHHGRETGRVPDEWLDRMDPKLIVLGEVKQDEMNELWHYPGWETLNQNDVGDITFDCVEDRVDVYVSSSDRFVGSIDV